MARGRRNSAMLVPTVIMGALAILLLIIGYIKGEGEHIVGVRSGMSMIVQMGWGGIGYARNPHRLHSRGVVPWRPLCQSPSRGRPSAIWCQCWNHGRISDGMVDMGGQQTAPGGGSIGMETYVYSHCKHRLLSPPCWTDGPDAVWRKNAVILAIRLQA